MIADRAEHFASSSVAAPSLDEGDVDEKSDQPPGTRTSLSGIGWLAHFEGYRVVPLTEAARLAGISVSTLKRRYADLLVRVGERRLGIRLRDLLALARSA
jgi:hypothetical protein